MISPILEETVYKDFITSSSTGAAADADSLPTVEIFEDATDTSILSPTVVKRTSKTGNYRIPIVCSAANGFEINKSYNIIVSATVGGVAAKSCVESFQVRANNVADVVAQIGTAGVGLTAVSLSTAGIQAIWNSLLSVTYTVGSIGAKFKLWLATLGADNKVLLSSDAQTGVTIPTVTTTTTATNLTNAPTSGDLTATMKTSVTTAASAATPALSAGGVQAIWDALTSALTTTGSIGKRIMDFVTTLVYAAPPAAAPSAAAIRAEIDTNSTQLQMALGLLGNNQGCRNFVYTSNVLQSYDVCIYDTAVHAATNDGVTGLLHKHTVSLTYTSTNQTGQVTAFVS